MGCGICGADPYDIVSKKFRARVASMEIWFFLSTTEIQPVPFVKQLKLSYGKPAQSMAVGSSQDTDEGQHTSHFKLNSNSRS